MKHTPNRWWDRRADERQTSLAPLSDRLLGRQSSFRLPTVRAWLRTAIEGVLASSQRHIMQPAPKTVHATAIPKRAMKLLRKIASGYKLIGVLEWGRFWLFKKALLPALTAMVHWLLEHGYIARGLVNGWSLTGAGRDATRRQVVTATP